jgi:hypothetical protein
VRRPTHDGAKKRAERERQAGLDPDDEAAKWLEEHDPKGPVPQPESKSRFKSKELHRWRQRQRNS